MKFKTLCACLVVTTLCCAGAAFAEDLMNLNSATQKELADSPAIGPDLAAKIVEYRENVGDFSGWEELKEVEGITDAKLKEISEHFQIEGVAAFDCNC